MERLRGAGCNVGEYTGDGQGEFVPAELHSVEEGTGDANPEAEHRELEDGDDDGDDNDDDGIDLDHHPLLIFYDCEATGLSIYNDHITDIGAKVVACPTPLRQPTFSSLVRTTRHIPAPGKNKNILRHE